MPEDLSQSGKGIKVVAAVFAGIIGIIVFAGILFMARDREAVPPTPSKAEVTGYLTACMRQNGGDLTYCRHWTATKYDLTLKEIDVIILQK